MTGREWVQAAKRRDLVELEDGGSGRLIFVRPNGTRATIELRPGVYKSVPVSKLKRPA